MQPINMVMIYYGDKKLKKKKRLPVLEADIRGSLNKFLDFFRMGTFIDSTHMKLLSPSKDSPPAAMHLLYRSNNLWKAP